MESAGPIQNVEPMTFADKLTNIFASPGELFENVGRTGPTTGNWLFPWLIYVGVAFAVTQLITGNASLAGQLEQMMRAQYDQSMEEAIIRGDLTQEEADKQFEQWMSPGSPWFTLVTIGGTVLTLPILFGLSFVFFQLGKAAMGASAPYMKVVEVVGLTFLIESLGELLATALIFLTDSIHASFGPALLITDYDPSNTIHLSIGKIHLFRIWTIGVVSIGLSRLFQRDFLKVLTLVGSLWILWILFWIFWDIFFG